MITIKWRQSNLNVQDSELINKNKQDEKTRGESYINLMNQNENQNEIEDGTELDRIKVIDSYMGSGKTSLMIQMMNESDSERRFIYITPYLKQVNRIIDSCPNKHFAQPSVKEGKGRKSKHLLSLIKNGDNICSTHAVFKNISSEMIEALRSNQYDLIMDETFNVIEPFDIYAETSYDDDEGERLLHDPKDDMNSLIDKGYLAIQDNFLVKWIDVHVLKKYNILKELSDRNLLYFINSSLLLWSFPPEVFQKGIFKQIYLLTYLFDYQVQSYYYKFFDVQYSTWHIEREDNRYIIVRTENNDLDRKWKNEVKNKIHIVEDKKLNRIGDVSFLSGNRLYSRDRPLKTALSKTWYDNNPESFSQLGNNVVNFFQNMTNAPGDERLWSVFAEYKNKVKNRNLSKHQFISINARATNDYADRKYLAYCVNRYLPPAYIHFFNKKGIRIDQDKFALIDMIQLIWRTAIRNGEEIWVYIPSARMRHLLKAFLDNKEIRF